MKKGTKCFIACALCLGVAYFVYNNVLHPINTDTVQQIHVYK